MHSQHKDGKEQGLRIVKEEDLGDEGFWVDEPDWEFFMPEEEALPEPGDFWIDDDWNEAA